jgi:hypothetical protein
MKRRIPRVLLWGIFLFPILACDFTLPGFGAGAPGAAAGTPADTPVASVDIYAVVLVPEGGTLEVRTGPGADNPAAGSLAWDATDLRATGNTKKTGGIRWVELNLPGSGKGWVDRTYLTEYAPPSAFCADPAPVDLLGLVSSVAESRDGIAFASITSLVHNLTVTYIHNGNPKVYTPLELETAFEDGAEVDWGPGPGSGLPVTGTFNDLVQPDLMYVFGSEYSLHCNAVQLGGASYSVEWPAVWKNINYYSVYRPGPAGNEMAWMTWLAGVEYVDGIPYLFSLSRYNWEP